jgi:hypothetical protein
VVGWIKQVAWLRQSKARGHSSAGADPISAQRFGCHKTNILQQCVPLC